MNINFSKYQGTGNDFVIIDNRDGNISLSNKQIAFAQDILSCYQLEGLITKMETEASGTPVTVK